MKTTSKSIASGTSIFHIYLLYAKFDIYSIIYIIQNVENTLYWRL